MAVFYACGDNPLLPEEYEETAAPPIEVPEDPSAPDNDEDDPVFRSSNRLVRRMTLDFFHRLPTSEEISTLSGSTNLFSELLERSFGSSELARGLAEKHRHIWSLNSRDAAVEAGITNPTSYHLTDDVVSTVAFNIQNERPYSSFFLDNFSLAPTYFDSLFGLTGTEGPSPDTELISYTNLRPAHGAASSLGMTASLSSGHDGTGNTKAYSLLKKIGCVELTSESSHNFNVLSDDYIAANLRSVSLVHPNCTGCHAVHSGLANSYDIFQTPASLTAWLSHDDSTFRAGAYSGHDFSDSSTLQEFISKDPRIRYCTVKKMIENIYQIELDFFENNELFALILNKFNESDNIKDVAKLIAEGAYYDNDIRVGENSNSTTPEYSVKFLSGQHFKGIIEDLSTSPVRFDLESTDLTSSPPVIRLGNDLSLSDPTISADGRFLPDETYMRAIYELAETLATKFVEEELNAATPMLANNRKIFRYLPDGNLNSPPDTAIQNQIITLWYALTSLSISTSTTTFTTYRAIYDAGAANDALEGWRAVLFAMFISPEFLIY